MADQNILNRLASGPATSGIVNTFSNARLAGEQIASAQHDRQMNALAAQQAQEDRARNLEAQTREQYAQALARVLAVEQTQGVQAASSVWDFEAQRIGRSDLVGQYTPESARGAAGMLLGQTGEGAPAAVREFQHFQALSPEQKQEYLTVKRAGQVKDIGGVPTLIYGSQLTPLSTIEREAGAAAVVEGAKTEARETTQERVKAQSDLPRVEANAQQMLSLLEKLEGANLGLIYGAASLSPIFPDTPQADTFALYEQLQGKAFLEAFNTLKGGGQITEKEGEKATAAVTRASNRRQSPAAAKAALQELRDIVITGVERARKKAGAVEAAPRNPQRRSAADMSDEELLRELGVGN